MEIVTAQARVEDETRRHEFDDRFEAARPRLTAICRAVAGADDAADLVQETYLRASHRIGQLRDLDRFDAWLVRIALNEAKGLHRRQRAERERLPKLVTTPPAASDVALREMVAELAPRERAVIVLHYAYGYRMGEIARLLGLTEINVRTVAFRARRRLRAQLEETSP